ncbi:hypothetical protein KVR01_003890 [Diaporthe batatas]|uniref:uncharacterized protein n=1 Tax=Diaporthe batatas TaxID=748121 RepID=UPI001D051555|nr:uncharacterized protein KVR01_003890 [Diaporthe batatas]KAG8168201.1 hypothetical protein KVR01_003890 [Diaporthe batatas]
MSPILQVRTLSPSSICLLGLVTVTIYVLARCAHLLFFHPLAKYPGPRLAAVTQLWQLCISFTGRQCFIMTDLHRKYGDVVRVGPNSLSFATPQSYRDIYGHVTHGKKRFLKTKWYEADEPRIVRVRDPVAHAEQRRTLSHAFSARALRDQEDVVHLYVDLLLRQLNVLGAGGSIPVNATEIWNWLTFDVIGDLAFGEPFGCLSAASSHGVSLNFDYLMYGAAKRAARNLGPMLGPLFLRCFFSKRTAENHYKHIQMSRDKARRRIDRGSLGRHDFFDHLIKNGTLTESALMGNADTLIIAGSETTATALSGLTWYLLKNPSCLEGLRVFPPLSFGLPRDCPGAVIDGHFVPEGTTVANENYAMAFDPRYWRDPLSFRPERWVGAGFTGDDRRAFQPFSSGPRGCLGINLAYMEMRVSVAKLLWAFDLELASDIPDWNSACKNYILWKKPDLNVKFHPRVAI